MRPLGEGNRGFLAVLIFSHLLREGFRGPEPLPYGHGSVCVASVLEFFTAAHRTRYTIRQKLYVLMPKAEPAPQSSEQLLAAQKPVMELIASSAPLDDVLRALAALIDHQAPAGMCCIYLAH